MTLSKLAMAATIVLVLGIDHGAQCSPASAPRPQRGVAQRVTFESPVLPPMAFTQFCLRYAGECKKARMMFRGGRMTLTAARLAELKSVNTAVNLAIRPSENMKGIAGETWLIDPSSGDCNDYAVSKRHALMALGWSPASLLLSEVVVATGKHHLVVVVRTDGDDLVLDNLSANVVAWSLKPYLWLRMQTPANANYWSTVVGNPGAPVL